jgi:TPR repeat protein
VKRSADQGYLSAQYRYGVYLERGTGVAKDIAQALHFYKLAMDGGNAEAKSAYERLRQTA